VIISQVNFLKLLSKNVIFLAVLKSVLFVSVCNYLYRALAVSEDSALPAFVTNMLGAFCILLIYTRQPPPFRFLPERSAWFLVPILVLAISFCAGSLSSSGDWHSLELSPYILSVVFVPIAEELVFRVGLWGWLGGVPIGTRIYLTSASFAILHSASSPWPIGPLLLGIINQVILLRGGGVLTAILLHMACNATVVIFLALDPRWLDWLGVFYLH
jgi:membrane protease YdiL (CAAX protease family)